MQSRNISSTGEEGPFSAAMKRLLLMSVPLLASVPNLAAQSVPIYTYTVPSGGYAPNGILVQVQDSVNGSWGLGYDTLNRLNGATVAPVAGQTQYLCWSYDSFGNRTNQMISSSPATNNAGTCSTASSAAYSVAAATYGSNNRVTSTTLLPTLPADYYDASGNVTDDGKYAYLYDEEGRLCASGNVPMTGGGFVGTQYIYDAEGKRVGKGSISQPSCDRTANGFQATSTYVVDQNGQQVSELDGQGNWRHTNVYLGGQLLATYDPNGLHFNVTDALGTKRVQASGVGQVELNCANLPFGDGAPCANLGSGMEATEHRFTGKERDAESGLDYFGARYYASNMGRWMSPDLPFADQNPENPQSWNLYGYVRNNPLNSIDTNGRVTWLIGGTWRNPKDWTASSPLGQEMSGFFDPNDDDVETIEWSGGNTGSARAELSAKIAAAMAAHSWKPGEQNNIVCHSHGCNGVMGALPTLLTDGFFVNNLVSLGQPMRGDYPYSGGVDTWYNVYAGNDLVQKLGGRIPLFGGRKNSNANNFQVQTGRNPIAAHGALHNDGATRMQWEMFIRGAQQQDDSGGGGKRNCVDNTCHGIVP